MLSLQYIPVGPVCYWGLDSVEQASRVVLEEQEVMVVVEQVVEEKWQEESCTRASTPIAVHSTEVAAKHENETNEQQVETYGIKMDMTKEGVRTRKDE